MRFRSSLLALGFFVLPLYMLQGAAGCSDPIELVYAPSEGVGGLGGAGGGSVGGHGGDDISVGIGGSGGAGGHTANPCEGLPCEAGQHCVVQNDMGTCVNWTCPELACKATEECQVQQNGGAICVDVGCTTDADCALERFCDLGKNICVPDVCVAGARTCDGLDLHECVPNGSADILKYTCASQSYYTSACVDNGDGQAYCGCEDDWDCPSDTVCAVNQCSGTGKAPTCTIKPVPFTDALPTNEIIWGGKGIVNKDAVAAPFPASSQSTLTPIVANLDDDNGDGLINELDFPEIVFVTYCGQDITENGVIRAIHGGGPNKGKDYFATAGSNVWHEGDSLAKPYTCVEAIGNSTGAIAVGDLDGDGVPEIVVPTEYNANGGADNGLQILDNTGAPITTTAPNQWAGFSNPAVAIANIDNKGMAEIVVGNIVFTLDKDPNGKLIFVDKFAGMLNAGKQGEGPISCVANIAGDSRQEIIAGSTAYALPSPPAGVTKRADCTAGAVDDFCLGKLTVVWDAQAVNGIMLLPNAQKDGFCAVADVLGADQAAAPGPLEPLDGKPEVVLINEGYLVILDGPTGKLARSVNLNAGIDGGAPNIDDFDGDGFPEIGTALASAYFMLDLQAPSAACPLWPNTFNDALGPGLQGNPARSPGGACSMNSQCVAGAVCNKVAGQCTCLYNGWSRVTEDDSSRVTASSVFDFNGDGTAEVIYNDECYFRIYDGQSGAILSKHENPSRTKIENPVVADVDNDGNAEIVFVANNEAAYCSTGVDFPNGIQVWGDANDAWVSARRIWNQHAYHVTNVLEGGGIPMLEPESWKTYNGRVYNTYRSNPRAYGIAPDLTIPTVQIFSPDATCGQLSKNIDITAQIANLGDIHVGPGVVVTFYGEWSNPALKEPLYADMNKTPLKATIQSSIEPGGSILLTASYKASNNSPGTLPDKVSVVVDEASAGAPFGKERECNEANNEQTKAVNAGMVQPDLRILIGQLGFCPSPTVEATVFNDGSAPAKDVLVRYYSGDPNQGGQPLFSTVVPGPIAPGGSETFVVQIPMFPSGLAILIYAIVDPENAIAECNDGNNKDNADDKLFCSPG